MSVDRCIATPGGACMFLIVFGCFLLREMCRFVSIKIASVTSLIGTLVAKQNGLCLTLILSSLLRHGWTNRFEEADVARDCWV